MRGWTEMILPAHLILSMDASLRVLPELLYVGVTESFPASG